MQGRTPVPARVAGNTRKYSGTIAVFTWAKNQPPSNHPEHPSNYIANTINLSQRHSIFEFYMNIMFLKCEKVWGVIYDDIEMR